MYNVKYYVKYDKRYVLRLRSSYYKGNTRIIFSGQKMATLSAQLEVALKSVEDWSLIVNDAIKSGASNVGILQEREIFLQAKVDDLKKELKQEKLQASIAKLEEDLKVTTQPEEKIRIEENIKREKVRFDNLTLSKFIFLFLLFRARLT
jgi:hypothetical protein